MYHTKRFFILVNFSWFIWIKFSIVLSEQYDADKTCAVLYKEQNFEGSPFEMKDGQNYGDMEDIHLTLDDVRNVTETVRVTPGCLFTACNDTYFAGVCKEFKKDILQMPREFESLLSANCTCAGNCQCSDVYIRKTGCARAYINTDCNTCNSYYTDLKGSKEAFEKTFQDTVVSILTRKGCTLTLFPYEDFEGEATILESRSIEDWKGSIGSYECFCDEKLQVDRPKKRRPSHYPPLIQIPGSADDISSMADQTSQHPGLLAALQSIKSKRSPRNAYILLLGMTGAGKSSAVNLLFDNPNVTTVGGVTSTTTDIHEFRIPIPVDELGLANSELRVIDTPGLGDTRGLEQDARFLATLDDYLSGHEELSKRIPNVVLVFAKFNDNRILGVGAAFVKMLRGIDSFPRKITDTKYSNIIFVLSHFTSETNDITRRPTKRINSFKNVIENYSLFPKPISIVVAENKAEQEGLPMINGYFKLPNGDFYPRNLFDKIQLATVNGADPIGEAIIRTAFRDADDFNVTEYNFPLVGPAHRKVEHYFHKLSGAIFNITNTEVSQMLHSAYQTMSSDLRKRFPLDLQYLQRSLNIRSINTKADVPRTTLDIVKLLKDLKKNEATLYLLEKAFGLKVPVLKENLITGHSYNVIADKALPASPFKLGSLQLADIGYLIPSVMSCIVNQSPNGKCEFFKTREEYLRSRLHELNVEETIPMNIFTGTIQPGANIINEMTENGVRKVSAVKEYRTFELVLNDKLELSDEFIQEVLSLPKYNETNYDSVERWKSFFEKFGTHVVRSTYGGGAIEIELQSNQELSEDELVSALFELIQFAEDVTIGKKSKVNLNNEGAQHHLRFKGGDEKFHTTDLKSMTLTEATELLDNWRDSLLVQPAILKTHMKLMPISQVVHRHKKLGQSIATEIQMAALALFNSSLSFKIIDRKTASPPPPPDARDNVQKVVAVDNSNEMYSLLLKNFMEQQRRSEENFKNLTMTLQLQYQEQAKHREELRKEERKEEFERQERNQEEWKRQRELDRQRDIENQNRYEIAAQEAAEERKRRIEREEAAEKRRLERELEDRQFQREEAEKRRQFELDLERIRSTQQKSSSGGFWKGLVDTASSVVGGLFKG